jgi:hypothetical protein
MFNQALGMLSGRKEHLQNQDIDEEQAVRAHQQMYGNQGGGDSANPQNMGMAAAMQALKMFTGGQGGGSGSGQNQFIGMAMAEASKLFDQKSAQGHAPPGGKQNAISSAAQMALHMYMKSEMGGRSGAGGLMSLAGKFF